MELEQIIEELHAVIDAFNEERGACPVCMLEAVKVLEALNTIKEA